MGPVELPGEAVLLPLPPVLLLLPLQAARTLTESTATALMTSAFFEKQGRSALTPGSSFLLVQGPSSPSSSGNVGVLTLRVIPVECASCAMNAAKSIYSSHSRPDPG
jgi:hypothetical protein